VGVTRFARQLDRRPSLGQRAWFEHDCRARKAREHSRNLNRGAERIECLLLQINSLIMPSLIELCTPHLVHALMVGPAEEHGRAEPDVELAQIFQSPH